MATRRGEIQEIPRVLLSHSTLYYGMALLPAAATFISCTKKVEQEEGGPMSSAYRAPRPLKRQSYPPRDSKLCGRVGEPPLPLAFSGAYLGRWGETRGGRKIKTHRPLPPSFLLRRRVVAVASPLLVLLVGITLAQRRDE